MSNTKVTNDINKVLDKAIEKWESDDIFILTDTNTYELCLPKLLKSDKLKKSHVITISAGDDMKNVDSLQQIWAYLSENGATRKSLMINLGGGMITDIGGFAAATFKRGIDYINVSTTLLGAVDAATGGKTGINFLGFKNEIGSFAPAKDVFISVDFFKTLDDKNIRSGYAEMLKHALISSKNDWQDVLKFDLEEVDFEELTALLERNSEIKENIVEADPKEQGIRKALNLGHTFAHAIESWSYTSGNPVLHGYAVAWGLVCELYLSHIKLNFPKEELLRLKYFVREHYGRYDCGCDDYDELIELMKHDKKNEKKLIIFTLLSNVGEVVINQTATNDEIIECLDFLVS
ncbi:MAG: 3-dehydroquinate synthase [Porphyromonadaceae bacterium]|nr:3-dehydroquinate synthase [Porphyromonadaceae bacterium]